MKLFLTAFGLHNPFAGPRLQDHGPMPVSTESPHGFDLDYSSLLLAGSFVIDRSAYEFVAEHRSGFLLPMFRTLVFLRKEGLLEVVDYGAAARPFREKLISKTNELLDDLDPWLRLARSQWQRVQSEFLDFARKYSPADRAEFNSGHYGVIAYLDRRDGRVDPTESARLHRLLESRRRLKATEREEMRTILQPLVAQVLLADLLRRCLGAPFLDWDDAQEFHDRIQLSQWAELDSSSFPSAQIAPEARRLFEVVVPELLPERIEDVVRFIRDRRAVESLRSELWELQRTGKRVSKEWMLALHDEVDRAELRAGSRSRVVTWAGRAINLAVPGAGIAGEALLQAAEEIADSTIKKRALHRFEWYYALQRLRARRQSRSLGKRILERFRSRRVNQ
jgi:hypothetical protein